MLCCVEACDREAHYKEAALCQKHYFRLRRNGTAQTVRKKARPRVEMPHGYQWVHDPSHPLRHKNGYVAEHRAVLYAAIGPAPMLCELCGVGLTWKTCKVDHIDNNPRNNERTNLRPTCNTCNSHRGIGPAHRWSRTHAVEYGGEVKTPAEWARDPRVKIAGNTIVLRLNAGMTPEQALFAPKVTHNGNLLR